MKIKFSKDENNQITTRLVVDEELKEFDYIELINALYSGNMLEQCEYEGNFSDDVKSVLDELVEKVCETVDTSLNTDQDND